MSAITYTYKAWIPDWGETVKDAADVATTRNVVFSQWWQRIAQHYAEHYTRRDFDKATVRVQLLENGVVTATFDTEIEMAHVVEFRSLGSTSVP